MGDNVTEDVISLYKWYLGEVTESEADRDSLESNPHELICELIQRLGEILPDYTQELNEIVECIEFGGCNQHRAENALRRLITLAKDLKMSKQASTAFYGLINLIDATYNSVFEVRRGITII